MREKSQSCLIAATGLSQFSSPSQLKTLHSKMLCWLQK